MINYLSKYYPQVFPVVLFLFFIFSGCSENNRINEDKFVKIYADLVIANDTLSADNDFNKFRIEIFKRHDVSEEQYQKTVEFYNEKPERWKLFFDKVLNHVKTLQKNGQI